MARREGKGGVRTEQHGTERWPRMPNHGGNYLCQEQSGDHAGGKQEWAPGVLGQHRPDHQDGHDNDWQGDRSKGDRQCDHESCHWGGPVGQEPGFHRLVQLLESCLGEDAEQQEQECRQADDDQCPSREAEPPSSWFCDQTLLSNELRVPA